MLGMERRTFGSSGWKVSLLGFGGAEIGHDGVTLETVSELLHRALDAGLNVIDTASAYGTSEELIGQALEGRRDEFYLFTKAGYEAGYRPDYSPANIRASLERSLRRLRTDRVDLLQIHSCPLEDLQRGDIIDELDKLKTEGKTRLIGYSGDREAAEWAVQSGRFDALQTSLNLFDQESATRTLPEAHRRGMGIIIKRPIGNAVWRYAQRPENSYFHVYWDRMNQLAYDFLKPGAPAEGADVALRFTAAHPEISTMIVGTTNPRRWFENAQVLNMGPLDPAQFHAIRDHWTALARNPDGTIRPGWEGQQ
jgi:aryl-alcohol dehydrogenase-like predicted oxidoreductase